MFKAFFLAASLLAGGVQAQSLSLQDYLVQVQQGNSGFKAQQETHEALKLAMLEPQIMLSPRFATSLSYFDDQSVANSPFNALRTTASSWSTQLSKQFDVLGTRVGLGYKGGESSVLYPAQLAYAFSAFGGGMSNPSYFDSNAYFVTVEQPLWKDFGARGYKVAQAEADSGYGQAIFLNQYQAAASLFEAETAYIQVASTRQILQLLRESLERNQKILDWTKDKYNDNLADKVDVLQVKAALAQVQMGINETEQALRVAQQKFNTLRGLSATAELSEELDFLKAPQELPAAKGERLDIQAAVKSVQGKDALAEEVKERYRPDLSIFGMAQNSAGGAGWSSAAQIDDPTYQVGVKFSTMLDASLYFKVIEGAKKAANQSKDDLRQKRLKEEEDWADLNAQWQSVQKSLQLGLTLEEIQKDKAEREKKRYQDGRTTNFQVLRFDEDYNQARISTLRLTAQAAVLAAQANFYNGGGIQW